MSASAPPLAPREAESGIRLKDDRLKEEEPYEFRGAIWGYFPELGPRGVKPTGGPIPRRRIDTQYAPKMLGEASLRRR